MRFFYLILYWSLIILITYAYHAPCYFVHALYLMDRIIKLLGKPIFCCILLCSVTNNKVSCTNICIAVQRWYVPDYEMHDTVTTLNITYLHIHGYCSIRQRKYKLYHFIYFLAYLSYIFIFRSTEILIV